MKTTRTTVTRYRKDTNHAAHIIWCLLTGGAWLIIGYGPLLIKRSIWPKKVSTTDVIETRED
jgi:hypothetical protein